MSEQTPAIVDLPWSDRKASYKKAMQYLTGRLRGEITSMITPWNKFNDVGVAGWEWGSAVAICARPGVGKTVLIDQLCKEVFALNPNTKIRILKFELEMLAQVTAIREFSSVLEKSYAYVCSVPELSLGSAGEVLGKSSISQQELIKCWEYVQNKLKVDDTGNMFYPEDIIEKAPTVMEFIQIIHRYMDEYCWEHGGLVYYPHVLITIDHLRLLQKEPGQSENQMLYEACLAINRLKKQYDRIIFVAANHLGRDVNEEARCKEGEHANYLRDSDIFGADAIMQNFDIVSVWDRPALRHIKYYGPSRYIIEEDHLVAQFVKVRNGVPGMTFFRGLFEQMKVVETEIPPRGQKQIQTKMPFKS